MYAARVRMCECVMVMVTSEAVLGIRVRSRPGLAGP